MHSCKPQQKENEHHANGDENRRREELGYVLHELSSLHGARALKYRCGSVAVPSVVGEKNVLIVLLLLHDGSVECNVERISVSVGSRNRLTTKGKWRARSLPLRVIRVTAPVVLAGHNSKAIVLDSWIRPGSAGGRLAGEGRRGSIAPRPRARNAVTQQNRSAI